MILRIFRGQVRSENGDRLVQYVRNVAIRDALETPGLVSFEPAVRASGSGLELLIASTWTDFDALINTGHDLATPVSAPALSSLVTHGSAEHYELVIGGARGIPVRGATLRLIRSRVKPNFESAYFGQLRRETEALIDDDRLVTVQLGRRDAGGWDEVVSVIGWATEPILDDNMVGDLSALGRHGPAAASCWDEPVVEYFDALTQPEVAHNPAAILLADDAGRYLHATPESARLTGRSVARLLTMRVEDLAAPSVRPQVLAMWQRFLVDGSMAGAFALEHPDGTEVEVQFAARAHVPWPGCHASLLVPAGTPSDLDVEAALVAAGFAPANAYAS
ncbi:MAG TPA: hypothetical protein VFV53_08185 [Candidatus Limnocylindrales bacterium]|nr:hypothetical protein [Candidatus Limnocylindrales bacterium]